MIYVMSDIHGCYDKYLSMLQVINLKKSDRLYVLGDVVDRGPDGIRILLDMSNRENVTLLRGNHDNDAETYLNLAVHTCQDIHSANQRRKFKNWLSDGGESTYRQFLSSTIDEKRIALHMLHSAAFNTEIVVNEVCYFLAHTVPERELLVDSGKCPLAEYLWGEPDYDEVYFKDKVIITGHTPTHLIDTAYRGKIWKGNNHIVIDCGAVFGNSLGCLCLDTMEEFYV